MAITILYALLKFFGKVFSLEDGDYFRYLKLALLAFTINQLFTFPFVIMQFCFQSKEPSDNYIDKHLYVMLYNYLG